MPPSLTIDLPLVIEGEPGRWLVRPVGFPEFALASSSLEHATGNAKRRVAKLCRQYVGSDLVARLIRGEVQHESVCVEFPPAKKSALWRGPVSVDFATFVWSQGKSLVVTYVPRLDLTIIASPGTDVAKLVEEQIRSAVRRSNGWSLQGLFQRECVGETRLESETLRVDLPTPAELARQNDDRPQSKTPTLRAVATRLKRKSLPPAFHRDEQVERLAQLLTGQHSRSVLLVGPSGVGKTAIFNQWVRTRNRWDMQHVRCWSTDGSRLISGQCGFGMWQKQCLAMADEAAQTPSIVHLGNLVELSEAGRMRGSGGCGSLLAPRLADGSLLGVIECTPEQLTRIERVEPRLVAALTRLTIAEPTPEENRWILLEAAAAWRPVDITAELKKKRRRRKQADSRRQRSDARLESTSRDGKMTPSPARLKGAALPTVQPEALQALDRLHRRFQTDAAAPGRPLAFFETVMSEMRPGESLDAAKVIAAFGRQTGLPPFLVDDRVRPDLGKVRAQLASQVLGQSIVIETLVDVIATMATDLSRGDRPLASLMLIGPTGVGKTETAKALSRLIYSDVARLVRIDMSELSSPSAVGRLIGDVVNAEGLLTSAVRAQPFSLVLLDEFEKAHPSVFDLLLQVLGEGRLTDGQGRVADFRNSIVMMTSNLGVESFRDQPLGLADTNHDQRYREHFEKQVRDFLRPEMFNRIDRILSYAPLSPATVRQIADLQLKAVPSLDGCRAANHRFDCGDGVAAWLAQQGYEPQFGARPLQRQVQRSVLVPLANAICDIGRNQAVDVSLRMAENQDASQRVAVKVKAVDPNDRREKDEVRQLVDNVTLLRRRGQSLDRCSAMTQLRNRYTTAKRVLKRRLDGAKTSTKRDTIRHSVRARHCRELRDRIRAIDKLVNDVCRAESRLLCGVYREEPIDKAQTRSALDALKRRLWDRLCELQSQRDPSNQRISLVLMGPKLELAQSLLEGYRRIAMSRSWNLQVHALLPRDDGGTKDRVIDADGWSREPSFRVGSDPVSMSLSEMMSKLNVAASDDSDFLIDPDTGAAIGKSGEPASTKPAMAAYGLIKLSELTSLPTGTLGVMLTFGGHAAEMMMAGEVGVHTFGAIDRKNSQQQSVLIKKHLGTPIQYKAPHWLPERKFEMSGQPRRGYDTQKGLVIELGQETTQRLKMDREGHWLEKLLEQEMERRIWATLDDDPDQTSVHDWEMAVFDPEIPF